MRQVWFVVAVVAFGISLNLEAQQGSEKKNRGRLMWSAFACSTYAEMAGDKKEQSRLFELGYATGKQFLNDIEQEKVSEHELKKMPIGIRFVLGGPSIEFILGRIYSLVVDDAYESVVKKNEHGLLIQDPMHWASDEVATIKAKGLYSNSNCEILR